MAQQSRATRQPTRLCISGSAGVGKTTLARKLATALGIPFSSDQVRETLAVLGHSAHRTMRAEEVLELCFSVVAKRTAFERDHESFVADTSTVDNAAFFVRRVAQTTTAEHTAEFVQLCKGHVNRYTRAIVLPFGGLTFIDDGVRNPDLAYQKSAQNQIEKLYEEWSLPHTPMPGHIVDLDARVEWCRTLVEA